MKNQVVIIALQEVRDHVSLVAKFSERNVSVRLHIHFVQNVLVVSFQDMEMACESRL